MRNKITRRLLETGWKKVEYKVWAKGNYTFNFETGMEAPGGAVIRLWASPWDAYSEDIPELIERFDIWLNYPAPILEVVGVQLTPSQVMAQISNVTSLVLANH